jgi:hypothetical protein
MIDIVEVRRNKVDQEKIKRTSRKSRRETREIVWNRMKNLTVNSVVNNRRVSRELTKTK